MMVSFRLWSSLFCSICISIVVSFCLWMYICSNFRTVKSWWFRFDSGHLYFVVSVTVLWFHICLCPYLCSNFHTVSSPWFHFYCDHLYFVVSVSVLWFHFCLWPYLCSNFRTVSSPWFRFYSDHLYFVISSLFQYCFVDSLS